MFDEIVESIINGSIDENILLNLAKRKKLSEVYEGKTLLNYILEYKRNTEEFDKFSVYNSEIAIKYLEYGLNPNIDSEEIFMSKYDEEKTIFEKYIGKYFGAPLLNIITNLIKDGRNLKEILFCKIDNKYVFEHLEEKGLNTTITYMLVANANKKDLVNVIVNGKSLLEYLYETFVNNEKYSLKSRKKFIESLRKKADSKDENSIFIAKMAFKYGDFATTLKNESFLLQKDKLSGESYLDIIIKELLQNNSIETLISIKNSANLLTHKSKYLNGKMVIEYILDNFKKCFIWTKSSSEDLLFYIHDKGMTLLEFLIRNYREFVVAGIKEKWPMPPIFNNIVIISILQTNGINVGQLNFVGTNEYFDIFFKEKAKEETGISEEANRMIEEFRDLLLKNRHNDKNLIELACLSFRRQFANGFEYAYRDLQTMIEVIKKNGLRLKRYDSSHFGFHVVDSKKLTFKEVPQISVKSPYLFSSFAHEMTHFLRDFTSCTDDIFRTCLVPSTYARYASFNSEQIEKIVYFIKSFHERLKSFKESFKGWVNAYVDNHYLHYYDGYGMMIKNSILSAQKDIEIPIEYVTSTVMSEAQFKILFEEELKEEIETKVVREEFDVEFALENMLDALSKGDFLTNGIKFDGEKIYFSIGHGKKYFKNINPFDEVIACYGEIIKSSRKDVGFAILKDVMGQEFIDMLDEFYANMYLKDSDYKIEGESYGL